MRLSLGSGKNSCCNEENTQNCNDGIILAGSPNVGKSVLFNRLTNSYATVSNYPGTTVTMTRGKMILGNNEYEVVDTPGIYSLTSITEEEKVAQTILLSSKNSIVLHVIDAKCLERMLPLTLQLIEASVPLILVLNLMDEAEEMGLKFNIKVLKKKLGIPVVPIVAIKNIGIDELKEQIKKLKAERILSKFTLRYGDHLEQKINNVEKLLGGRDSGLRAKALLALQGDVLSDGSKNAKVRKIIEEIKADHKLPPMYMIAVSRQKEASRISSSVLNGTSSKKFAADKLNSILLTPITGVPILMLFLYFALYKFVGEFGAGEMVNFIEGEIFGRFVNPFLTDLTIKLLPWKIVQDLFVGDYGIITLGLRYAVAIILPIVSTFFLVFALIEDSGYLPRLAMLIDKIFKKIGLSGRAVIPLILGLGCSTMATMVTRTLPTIRERVMATLLLALAIPCSAQMGVLFTILIHHVNALILWGIVMTGIFLTVGFLGAKLLPGNPPIFFIEVPPLRMPSISNVLTKTYSRVAWYFQEVFPLFILASVFLWFSQYTGILNFAVNLLSGPVEMMGLPEKTAVAYIFGFFRRDYGAAGLYDMDKAGLLTANQIAISSITMTLLPACVAQALMMMKERGIKTGAAIFIFCVLISFLVGFGLNYVFNFFNVSL